MNRDRYEEAWTKLLAARRNGNIEEISRCAMDLSTTALALHREQQESLGPCSHFMVANGHCINCHEQVFKTINPYDRPSD